MTIDEILDNVFEERRLNKRYFLNFNEYCQKVKENPELYIQNIFQLMSKMIKENTFTEKKKLGIGEYTYYDLSNIFEKDQIEPFFSDQIFSSQFIETFLNISGGDKQNRIYIFEGPHGCGKSIFLNNLIEKFCNYANSNKSQLHEIVWVLEDENKKDFQIPCPCHDHPFLLVPRSKRKEFLDELIPDNEFKNYLFNEKEFEWIFKREPCAVCEGMFQSLIDIHDDFNSVFDHVYTQKRVFDRKIGEGIAVYNINDSLPKKSEIYNNKIQEFIDKYFQTSNKIKYVYSNLAKTNDGIYALMDIKRNNISRYKELHSISSEGTQRVENFEEQISSLFIAVSNPNDEYSENEKENFLKEKSFEDRKIKNQIHYVLDDLTERRIYYNVLGNNIKDLFMPEVIRSFARVIVATRMKKKSNAIEGWIKNKEKYSKYCDSGFLILKMNLYNGHVPDWISEEDLNSLDNENRKKIMKEGTLEGDDGVSGRYSIKLLQELIIKEKEKTEDIGIENIYDFFKNKKDVLEYLPEDFLEDVIKYYDYTVLNQIKDCLYDYNFENIKNHISEYLYSIIYENEQNPSSEKKRKKISESFLKEIENNLLGYKPSEEERYIFREEQIREYAKNTVSREIEMEGRKLEETKQFVHLMKKYQYNLKENELKDLKSNDTFRQAIKDYENKEFRKYDDKIKDKVEKLLQRLIDRYDYDRRKARKICIYVIDKNLVDKF